MTQRNPNILTLPEAAALAGKHRQWAWQHVTEHGHLLGVEPIRVSRRKVYIPRIPFERALGIAPEAAAQSLPQDWFDL